MSRLSLLVLLTLTLAASVQAQILPGVSGRIAAIRRDSISSYTHYSIYLDTKDTLWRRSRYWLLDDSSIKEERAEAGQTYQWILFNKYNQQTKTAFDRSLSVETFLFDSSKNEWEILDSTFRLKYVPTTFGPMKIDTEVRVSGRYRVNPDQSLSRVERDSIVDRVDSANFLKISLYYHDDLVDTTIYRYDPQWRLRTATEVRKRTSGRDEILYSRVDDFPRHHRVVTTYHLGIRGDTLSGERSDLDSLTNCERRVPLVRTDPETPEIQTCWDSAGRLLFEVIDGHRHETKEEVSPDGTTRTSRYFVDTKLTGIDIDKYEYNLYKNAYWLHRKKAKGGR